MPRAIKRAVYLESKSPQEREKDKEKKEKGKENMTSSISSLRSYTEDSGSDQEEDSIILEPHRASGVESRWLEMMTRDKPPDVAALFDRIVKYLNGQHAIEKIAVREGISRRDVRRVLCAFDGYVIYVSFFCHFPLGISGVLILLQARHW